MISPTEQGPINACDAAQRTRPSNYPEPFASLMQGRTKRPLGDLFNLKNFGVNLVHLPPGSLSALITRTHYRTNLSMSWRVIRPCSEVMKACNWLRG